MTIKFSSAGITADDQTIIKMKVNKKDKMYRTTPPRKFEQIVGKITSVSFSGGTEVSFNCGGRNVQSDGRIYLPIDTVRLLNLDHDDVLYWKLSYTSTGIKITVGGRKR